MELDLPEPQEQTGLSSDLISHIHHLTTLLQNLPDALPLDPAETKYNFGLDADDVQEEGLYYAFNRNLEVCFATHQLQGRDIQLTERGTRYGALIKMFKEVAKEVPNNHDFLQQHWLERLISVAYRAGARIPDKYVNFSDRTWEMSTDLIEQTKAQTKTNG